MSAGGICQVCGTAPARHRCGRCGSLVCEDHYDADSGWCTECAGPGGGRQL